VLGARVAIRRPLPNIPMLAKRLHLVAPEREFVGLSADVTRTCGLTRSGAATPVADPAEHDANGASEKICAEHGLRAAGKRNEAYARADQASLGTV
jgi:hypothetical protein